MALGYCMSCNKLVSIRTKSRFEGYAMDWYPIPHDVPDAEPRRRCDGHKRAIK